MCIFFQISFTTSLSISFSYIVSMCSFFERGFEPNIQKILDLIEITPTNAQISFIWHKLVYMFRPSMAIIGALHNKNTENYSLSI